MARAAQHSETVLDILIEDCKEWDEAIAHLQAVPRKDAASYLQKYGKVIFDALSSLPGTSCMNVRAMLCMESLKTYGT